MNIPFDVLVVAFCLATALGVSIGVIASSYYVNWRLGKIWDGDAKGVLLQLIHDRALNVNAIVDIHQELSALHTSAGGLLRRLVDLKVGIEGSIGDLQPLRKELRLTAGTPERIDIQALGVTSKSDAI